MVLYFTEWRNLLSMVLYFIEWRNLLSMVLYFTARRNLLSMVLYFTEWKNLLSMVLYFTEWSLISMVLYFTEWSLSMESWGEFSNTFLEWCYRKNISMNFLLVTFNMFNFILIDLDLYMQKKNTSMKLKCMSDYFLIKRS